MSSASQTATLAPDPTRILLVEDDARLRRSTAALLESVGYEVETALSGEKAIAIYVSAGETGMAFDLVLMDQTLSGAMCGIETLRMLRALDENVRAVMLSGRPLDGGGDAARHGFMATLVKPVSLDTLQRVIETVLR